jgi:hypothetical protein
MSNRNDASLSVGYPSSFDDSSLRKHNQVPFSNVYLRPRHAPSGLGGTLRRSNKNINVQQAMIKCLPVDLTVDHLCLNILYPFLNLSCSWNLWYNKSTVYHHPARALIRTWNTTTILKKPVFDIGKPRSIIQIRCRLTSKIYGSFPATTSES